MQLLVGGTALAFPNLELYQNFRGDKNYIIVPHLGHYWNQPSAQTLGKTVVAHLSDAKKRRTGH